VAIIIKNIDSVSHTYAGQEILSESSYVVQLAEVANFASDENLLADILDNKAQINNGTEDISGVSNQIDYLKGIDTSPKDSDKALIVRAKAAAAGWTYQMTAIEAETSVLSSVYHKDFNLNDLNYTTLELLDDEDAEITVQATADTDCVTTVLCFEPPWDYEVVGGTIKTADSVSVDLRVWVVAVPDIPAYLGGSKVMVENVNLRFIDPNNGIEADGRACKFLKYDVNYHTNKLKLIFRHPAGHKEKIMIAFELFKA